VDTAISRASSQINPQNQPQQKTKEKPQNACPPKPCAKVDPQAKTSEKTLRTTAETKKNNYENKTH